MMDFAEYFVVVVVVVVFESVWSSEVGQPDLLAPKHSQGLTQIVTGVQHDLHDVHPLPLRHFRTKSFDLKLLLRLVDWRM